MQQPADLVATLKADPDLRQRIVRSVGSSSIALFSLFDDHGDHRLELAGSGTLVILKGAHFILTAAHVWEEMLKNALRLGITLTDNINHKSWIDIKAIVPKLRKPRNSNWTERGPDLALLRIPPEYVGGIKAFQVFEDVATPGKPMNVACVESWMIMGAPKELGKFSSHHADVQISGCFVTPQYHRRGKQDYFDVELDTTAPDMPKSFGGVSGGGLWRILVWTSPTTGEVDWLHRLKGVAFYEFPPNDGKRMLRCHGPKSLSELTDEDVELDVNTVADAYLKGLKGSHDKDGWAAEALSQSVRDSSFRGFAVILLVLEQADSDSVAKDIAVALKNLVVFHGSEAFDLVQRGCERSQRLRLAIGHVSLSPSSRIYSKWQQLKVKYNVAGAG